MKLTEQAEYEIKIYKLDILPTYLKARRQEYNYHVKTCERYGYKKLKIGICERNMIQALRMHKWNNSIEDWARLHAIESAINFTITKR